MTVGTINQHFDDIQQARARSAFNSIKDLWEGNDNTCTYTMTGLLMHLLRAIVDGDVIASSYINEKINIIEGEIKHAV